MNERIYELVQQRFRLPKMTLKGVARKFYRPGFQPTIFQLVDEHLTIGPRGIDAECPQSSHIHTYLVHHLDNNAMSPINFSL